MRTTLVIQGDLLKEAKVPSGARTKRETVEKALRELVARKRSRKLLASRARFNCPTLEPDYYGGEGEMFLINSSAFK